MHEQRYTQGFAHGSDKREALQRNGSSTVAPSASTVDLRWMLPDAKKPPAGPPRHEARQAVQSKLLELPLRWRTRPQVEYLWSITMATLYGHTQTLPKRRTREWPFRAAAALP